MYKLQMGCLIILIFISLMFFLGNKTKSKAHTLFSFILCTANLQIMVDMASVYTVNHLDSVNPFLNWIVHQVYMGLLILMFCLIFIYCAALVEEETGLKLKVSRLAVIVLILSYAGTTILPIEYIETSITNYAYGPAVYVTYASIVTYTFLTTFTLLRYWKQLEHKQKLAIGIAVIAEAGVFLYQAAIPTSLVSCLGVTVVNLGIFLPLENPDAILIEKLDEEKKRADAANNAKTAFIANMSHEIRTPINSVLGMNEMILRESTEENIRQYAGDVQYSAQALLGIINDILDIAKIESGKMEIIPVAYELRDFLYNVVNMMSIKARSKELEMEVFVDGELPNLLEGDDIRIRQVLVNLINNAIKYTHTGKVSFYVMKKAWDEKTAQIEFIVKDTGIGIKEEDIQKLFVAFERIEEKRNRNIEGTGLGINICVRLLDMMHSSLKVESEYGKGSVFSFVLEQKVRGDEPVGEFDMQKKRDMELEKYHAGFIAPDAKILVVDDNAMNRKVFKSLLNQTKVMVDEAESGLVCLEMVKIKQYDLIFMDHMMPGMDGVETFHALMEMPDSLCKNTPVIILTANAVIGARENYLREGFDAFLSKPIEPARLEQMIYDMLPDNLLIQADTKRDVIKAQNEETKTELPQIDGVDMAYGKLHFMEDEDLLEAFEMFYKVIKSEAEKLEEYFGEIEKEEGLNAYRIQVHSMKNSAATIGIVSLAGMAKVLEDAAKNQEEEVILAMTPIFLERWNGYKEKMQEFFTKEDAGKMEFDKDNVEKLLQDMLFACSDFDVTKMDEIMKQLEEYDYPQDFCEILERLSAAVMQLETENIEKTVEELKEMLVSE